MTYPTPGVVALVRDETLALLKLSPSSPEADRVERQAGAVLTLIADSLGRTETYGAVYVEGMPYDETHIPAPVFEAAVLATREMYLRKDAPFGMSGAWSQEGEVVRVSADPLAGVRHLLAPYQWRWGFA